VFSDPQSVTINAVANSLPRISAGANAGVFRKDDATVKLTISHAEAKRYRRMVRLDHNKLASDPYVTGDNVPVSMAAYMVIDVPLLGYTVAEQKQVVDGLTLFVTTGSGAAVTKILGGEI
jgi:hypothetical protein